MEIQSEELKETTGEGNARDEQQAHCGIEDEGLLQQIRRCLRVYAGEPAEEAIFILKWQHRRVELRGKQAKERVVWTVRDTQK